MTEKGDPVAKMSKADILKQFGPKILDQFGTDELRFIKNESKGPGGVDTLRRYVRDYFYNRGGMVKKKKLSQGGVTMKGKTKMAKKMMRGGAVPKRMRGGGMAKMASKKMMRGGVAAKKKMMRGGMAKKK